MLITCFSDLIDSRAVLNLRCLFISFVCVLRFFPGGKAAEASS